MTTCNFEAPQNVIQVLSHFLNHHRVQLFFTDLEQQLCKFLRDLIAGIMMNDDTSRVSLDLHILLDLLKDDGNLTHLMKIQGLLEKLARRISGPQDGRDTICGSIDAIWIIRHIFPESLPEIGVASTNINPILLEQILLAYAEYLEEARETDAFCGMNLALWALRLDIAEDDYDYDYRGKVNYAALQLLNRCLVDCQRPSRLAVDHLLSENAVPLLVRSAQIAWTSRDKKRWMAENILKETTELAIGIASVKSGRDQLLQQEFHEVLRRLLVDEDSARLDERNRRWLMYCIATIGGPQAILDYIQILASGCDLDQFVPAMCAAFQVLANFIWDRVNEDSFPEEGMAHYVATTKTLTNMVQQANRDPDSDRMMAILPDLIRAIRASVSKLNYYPKAEESQEVQRETLSAVFQIIKAKSKNDEMVQIAVEVLGIILEYVQVPPDDRQAVMEQLRESHRYHLSSTRMQHWILWTVLVVTDLPAMLTFMKEHIDAPAVQEGALRSLAEYFSPENMREVKDLKPVSEAVRFVAQAMQRFPHLRQQGVETLGALSSVYSDAPPRVYACATPFRYERPNDSCHGSKEIMECICKVLICEDRDSWSSREECVKALRQVLEGLQPGLLVLPPNAIDAIVTHLEANFDANDHQELFVDGIWLIGYSKGTGDICQFLNCHLARHGLFRCAFHALRDLYTQQPTLRQHPDNAVVCQMVEYALGKWQYVADTTEAARLMAGILS